MTMNSFYSLLATKIQKMSQPNLYFLHHRNSTTPDTFFCYHGAMQHSAEMHDKTIHFCRVFIIIIRTKSGQHLSE